MGIVGALLVEGEGTIDDEEEAMERRAVIWASADEEEALEGRAVILAPRRTRGVLASTGRISRPAIEAEQAHGVSVGACRAEGSRVGPFCSEQTQRAKKGTKEVEPSSISGRTVECSRRKKDLIN